MDDRFPAHLEIAALVRLADSQGGFASVLHKGERDAGSILVVLLQNGTDARAFERMPSLDGERQWQPVLKQDSDNKQEFEDYLTRRAASDPDLWIIELDIADGERLIGLWGSPG